MQIEKAVETGEKELADLKKKKRTLQLKLKKQTIKFKSTNKRRRTKH